METLIIIAFAAIIGHSASLSNKKEIKPMPNIKHQQCATIDDQMYCEEVDMGRSDGIYN